MTYSVGLKQELPLLSHTKHRTHTTHTHTHTTHTHTHTPTRTTQHTHTHTHTRETFLSHFELSSATATLTPPPLRCRSVFSSMRTTSPGPKGPASEGSRAGQRSTSSPASHLAAPTQTRRTLEKAQDSYHPSHGAILVCTGASLIATIRSTLSLLCRLDGPVPRRVGLCQQTK